MLQSDTLDIPKNIIGMPDKIDYKTKQSGPPVEDKEATKKHADLCFIHDKLLVTMWDVIQDLKTQFSTLVKVKTTRQVRKGKEKVTETKEID
jgi:hypothetical protein